MANENLSFLAKLAKLPLATKIISVVCVVVIIGGAAAAAVILSSPASPSNVLSDGGITSANTTGSEDVSDTNDDDVVVSSEGQASSEVTGGETSAPSTPATVTSTPTPSTPTPSTPTVSSKTESTATPPTTSSEVIGTPPPQSVTSTPTQTQTPAENVFFHDTNYADSLHTNNVTIKPRRVYWDNGKLQAECFVINGMSGSVWNVNVSGLRFYNRAGNIANASFGTLNANSQFNGSIPAHSYIIWTFTYAPDCIYNYGADLSELGCEAKTNYNH